MSTEMDHMAGPYLTFALGREEYGIAFDRVHEILGPDGIVEADNEKPCFKGTIKIRNQKMPILDLRCHFGLGKNEGKDMGAVLVTAIGENGTAGLLVDAIRQVLHIQANCLKPVQVSPEDPRAEFITGSAHIQGRVISLLNFDKGMEFLLSVSASPG